MKRKLICVKCQKAETSEPAYRCSKCGGILHYEADLKYWEESQADPVMGEGNTPLVPLHRAAQMLGLEQLSVKCEYMNPTGSFKDRGMGMAFTKAKELGVEKVIVASAGNASASAAAYGARAGLPVTAIVPESTSPEKVRQAAAYGAKVVRMKGKYSDSYQGAKALAGEGTWYNVTTTYINPYVWAGYESICRELVLQAGKKIDWILVPIGAGPFLGAIYHGFRDLLELGEIQKIPRLAGVQSDCCFPIADAFFKGETLVGEWNMTKPTIASGLNDELKGYTEDGDYTLNCIYQSKGVAVTVSDEEILEALAYLGREGIYTEPAGGAGIAAAKKLREQGILKSEDVVISMATGSGLKSNLNVEQKDPVLVEDIQALLRNL